MSEVTERCGIVAVALAVKVPLQLHQLVGGVQGCTAAQSGGFSRGNIYFSALANQTFMVPRSEVAIKM